MSHLRHANMMLVRRGRGLNPQDPGRESTAYKAAGLDHMPNLSGKWQAALTQCWTLRQNNAAYR